MADSIIDKIATNQQMQLKASEINQCKLIKLEPQNF